MIGSVLIPLKTSSTNTKLRLHWRALRRASKKERDVVRLVLAARFDVAKLRAALPVVVVLERRSPGILDGDNLQGALKAVRDEVAAFLGVDDGGDSVTWSYRQQRTSQYGVHISIEEHPSQQEEKRGP